MYGGGVCDTKDAAMCVLICVGMVVLFANMVISVRVSELIVVFQPFEVGPSRPLLDTGTTFH